MFRQHALLRNHVAALSWAVTNRWLAIRLDAATGLLLAVTGLVGVLVKGDVSAGLIGVALSQGLQASGFLQAAVRETAILGAWMVPRREDGR